MGNSNLRTPTATPARLRPRRPAATVQPEPPVVTDDAPLFMTIAKVAAKLDVSPDTVERMIARGDLKARRIGTGRCWRVEVASLTAWLQQG